MSERTKLSGSACELIEALTILLGPQFDPHFADGFVMPLFKLCSRANKINMQRASRCLYAMIEHAGVVRLMPRLIEVAKSPNKSLRAVAATSLQYMLKFNSVAKVQEHVDDLEAALKLALTDAESLVRDQARLTYPLYRDVFPFRSAAYV